MEEGSGEVADLHGGAGCEEEADERGVAESHGPEEGGSAGVGGVEGVGVEERGEEGGETAVGAEEGGDVESGFEGVGGEGVWRGVEIAGDLEEELVGEFEEGHCAEGEVSWMVVVPRERSVGR